MSKNYNNLLTTKVLKCIIDIFTDTFLVLYMLQLSNNNILTVGVYNIIQFTVTFITIFLLRNLIKTKNRIILFRIGILFNFIFFLLLFLLNEKIIQYIWLIAIVYGLEEGFYYSVFNIYESSIKKDKLARYSGTSSWINSIISILIPFIFGTIMNYAGFLKCTVIVLVLVIMKLILSILYKDKILNQRNKTNMKEYIDIVKKDKRLFHSNLWIFTHGLTYQGAFSTIVIIYIIREFSNSFELGIFTSVFAIITSIASYLFAHLIKSKSYKSILVICNILTIISLMLMVINCNMITIILFNFIQSFAKTYVDLIDWNNCLIVSNFYLHKKEEYFILNEAFIFAGRFISYCLLCLLAFVKTKMFIILIMCVFAFFIVCRLYMSIKLQNDVSNIGGEIK